MKIKELEELLAGAKDAQEALEIKKVWNGKHLAPLYELLAKAAPDKKREIGREINHLKTVSDEIFRGVKERLEEMSRDESIPDGDVSVSNVDLERISHNFLSDIRSSLISLFHHMDFVIEGGREIVSVKENFEDLNIPEDHPSRSDKETFYIDDSTILRPHCTVNSIRRLNEWKGESEVMKVATIGTVYRRDDETARHTHQFSQLDFLWLQKGLTASNLKSFLVLIFESIFGKDMEYRFRNSYFPFTQPSVEIDMKCVCGGNCSCSICGGSGWMEVLGAGLFRKKLLRNAGCPEEYECIAGGLGLERMALLKNSIRDIRYLYGNNFDFLTHKYDHQ